MKPINEKSGVRQQRGHKDFGCPPTPANPPDTVPDEAAVVHAVYTLLGDIAAIIGQPREFNFGEAATTQTTC